VIGAEELIIPASLSTSKGKRHWPNDPRSELASIGWAIWARVGKNRLEYGRVGILEFEELPEPAVQTPAVFKD
jgi:hypothetical protein